MNYEEELAREREHLAAVQQTLMAAAASLKDHAEFKSETIRMILADAWDELRTKPTALSPRELEQLDIEVSRFSAQRLFNLNRMEQYEKMLLKPYFARVDFAETGEDEESIVIGMYSLPAPDGKIMVHDWRAPVCSLYYDAMPGKAGYVSPSGLIEGTLTLKRQYRIDNGALQYYVDTDYSIDDGMLLDVLSGATSARMREIVSTIQAEQNRAIRQEKARVLCVTGGAGSGKTSVALHRAAYLMYHHRDTMNAQRILVVSPTGAFTEYISGVLPDLGEDNVRAMTLDQLIQKLVGRGMESQIHQSDNLLSEGGALRQRSVMFKSGRRLIEILDAASERIHREGPEFEDVYLGEKLFVSAEEIRRMYCGELSLLTPYQRLSRIRGILEARLEETEKRLYSTYEKKLFDSYRNNKELDFVTRFAVAQKLHPLRSQLRRALLPEPSLLYARALRDAPEDIARAAMENAESGVIWREDGPGIAYMALKLGYKKPDRGVLALLVDEAQDYSDTALRLMSLYFPRAGVTVLGDPNQRTLPGMPDCDAASWGGLFGEKDAPVMRLTRGYRCTRQIDALCRRFLPSDGGAAESVGREGEEAVEEEYDLSRLRERLAAWTAAGCSRQAVITRTHREAKYLHKALPGSFLLTGGADELEEKGVSVGCVSAMKGLEFDAVSVVWPMNDDMPGDEKRRLYTACSRALHKVALYDKSEE